MRFEISVSCRNDNLLPEQFIAKFVFQTTASKLLTRSKNKLVAAAKDRSRNPGGELCSCPRPNLKGPESTGKKVSKTVKPTAEPSQPVLPVSNPSIDLTTEESDSINMPTDTAQITPEDIFHLLQEQNERFTERWTEQAAAFSKVLETSLQTSAGTSKYNSVKLPTFSGEFNEDVNEFLTNFLASLIDQRTSSI